MLCLQNLLDLYVIIRRMFLDKKFPVKRLYPASTPDNTSPGCNPIVLSNLIKTTIFAIVGLLASNHVMAQETLPTAKQICAEARANVLRARLKYLQNPMQDQATITRIFAVDRNSYNAELRPAGEEHRKYPDIWLETFYAIAKDDTLSDRIIDYSVNDIVNVQGNVIFIDFVSSSQDEPRPACKITVRVDWDQAGTRP